MGIIYCSLGIDENDFKSFEAIRIHFMDPIPNKSNFFKYLVSNFAKNKEIDLDDLKSKLKKEIEIEP